MVLAESDVERMGPETRSAEGRRLGTRHLRIAVVASSDIQVIPWALWEFLMDGVEDKTTILLRRGNKSQPGYFEQVVRELVREQGHHLEVRWMMPDPDGGPGAAFDRDNKMVSLADLVLAFFKPDRVMQGGTGHVVQTAIDRNVPVYSFLVGDLKETGILERVGEHDPDAIWQERIGAFFDQ